MTAVINVDIEYARKAIKLRYNNPEDYKRINNMSDEDLINELEKFIKSFGIEILYPKYVPINDELEKLIKSFGIELIYPKWIPINDPSELPKKHLWITKKDVDNDKLRDVDEVYWDMTEWSDDISNVVAYMEFVDTTPLPYGFEESEKEAERLLKQMEEENDEL